MLAPPREHAGLFVPLAATDVMRLIESADIRRYYLRALSYMHDLVCPYWDTPDHPRFSVEDTIIDLGAIEERYFSSEDSLSKNVQDNGETAKYIGRRGQVLTFDELHNLRREATSFMKGLLFTYNQVRTL